MKQPKLLLILLVCLFTCQMQLSSAKIQKETKIYSIRNGQELKLDIYKMDSADALQPCLMFVFGGGFKEGSRDAAHYLPYFNHFALKGFTVVALDYRLGMKGEKAPTPLNNKPLVRAISLAVEDLYSATEYLIKHVDELEIDTSEIIISGSSAGAITVLQADYEKRNNMPSDTILSNTFQYAGVISFAGGIFSTEGLPVYKIAPAPTLFFHGSADKLVPYNHRSFLKRGMYGSESLAQSFKLNAYPFEFYSMENIGHEASFYPMNDFQSEIELFIRNFVFNKKEWFININFKDNNRKPKMLITPAKYYK